MKQISKVEIIKKIDFEKPLRVVGKGRVRLSNRPATRGLQEPC